MYRDQYLDACLALDGRGRHHAICTTSECQEPNPTFRCQDCFSNVLYCKRCIVHHHHSEPLHIIEVICNGFRCRPSYLMYLILQEWKNSYFQTRTLQSLGLCVQLGHQAGQSCPFRICAHKDFVVIHVNGVHVINLDFCCCDSAPSLREQLLEVGWWPSTPLEPQSAASMSVLRSFHIWNLQGQVTPTDFYRGLEQLTCGDGLTQVPVSSFVFSLNKGFHWCLGSLGSVVANGAGVAAHQNDETSWAGPRSNWNKWNFPR